LTVSILLLQVGIFFGQINTKKLWIWN